VVTDEKFNVGRNSVDSGRGQRAAEVFSMTPVVQRVLGVTVGMLGRQRNGRNAVELCEVLMDKGYLGRHRLAAKRSALWWPTESIASRGTFFIQSWDTEPCLEKLDAWGSRTASQWAMNHINCNVQKLVRKFGAVGLGRCLSRIVDYTSDEHHASGA